MLMRRVMGSCVVIFLTAVALCAAGSEMADAAMRGNKEAVRSLFKAGADVNGRQMDGATALHWTVQADDLETAELLIRAVRMSRPSTAPASCRSCSRPEWKRGND